MCKSDVSYRCKYCKRLFKASMTLNDAYLIEHLMRNHADIINKELQLEKLVENSYRTVNGRRAQR